MPFSPENQAFRSPDMVYGWGMPLPASNEPVPARCGGEAPGPKTASFWPPRTPCRATQASNRARFPTRRTQSYVYTFRMPLYSP